ncbi:4-hydroxy-tetrahydrodipicolinate synthase [Pseudoxanthomonas koreensis]|uniref:4-hydroxy-tetrahydrodipicolinate synthase n=1 Tax=Pseudoxanthomonas koreensis TaxID=266061 RepID=UPI00139165D8|nr:4-hydroxy-tetrahydrodipicolinate synthase [Pseudoxanthomonas koreensis]KAF1692478.1 4-hydroxy-tetrahydrodipicolinate synthase [Pseudoxanthomonas koreensis]
MHPTGLITALATPFDEAGALDLGAWRRLLEWQLAAGVEGVVVAGSTGEASMLADDEYDTLLRTAVQAVAGRVPVRAGPGQPGTARTIAQTRRAAALGADVALVVVPPYVRPTQSGMLAHFRAVADEGGLPVMLYNVPGRSGADLLPETVAALAAHERIVGIKEAVADAARIDALVALRAPGFRVLGGDDATAARALLAGADGLVSVGSNAAPAAYRRLLDLARGGDAAATAQWDARLAPLHAFCGVEPNPIPVKALLQRLGLGHGVRLPLLPLSARHHDEAARMIALARALEASCGREPLAA